MQTCSQPLIFIEVIETNIERKISIWANKIIFSRSSQKTLQNIQSAQQQKMFSGLTPGIKVKMLYFWFFMAFLGYFSSHFSGHPSHTVRAFRSFFLRQMFMSQSEQLKRKTIVYFKTKNVLYDITISKPGTLKGKYLWKTGFKMFATSK